MGRLVAALVLMAGWLVPYPLPAALAVSAEAAVCACCAGGCACDNDSDPAPSPAPSAPAPRASEGFILMLPAADPIRLPPAPLAAELPPDPMVRATRSPRPSKHVLFCSFLL